MIRLFLIVLLSYLPLLGADVPLPQERLRALPVLVRYDAQTFYERTHDLFEVPQHSLKKENGYKLLFKGIVFGQTFKVLGNVDALLNAALTKLVSEEEFHQSRIFYKTITDVKQFTNVKKVSVASRKKKRDDFNRVFAPVLDALYKDGNIYALFIQGFLEYDEAIDSNGSKSVITEKIERAADYLCLPALRFCEHMCDDLNKYSSLIGAITQGNKNYKSMYFSELEYIVELVENPVNFYALSPKAIIPINLPAMDVLEKVKKSANLFNPIFERTYLPEETSYYGRMISELMKISTDTRNSKPALGIWGQSAVIVCPVIGTLGGIVGMYNGELTAILTAVASMPTLIYSIQKQLSTPPVSQVETHRIDYEIDLIAMYFTLKKDKRFTEDTQKASRVFNLGVNENRRDQFYRFIARKPLTLSQMILMEEGIL